MKEKYFITNNHLFPSKDVFWGIALYGFILNALWEFAQAGPLYDMWREVSLAKGLFHITLAIIGDVVVVLSISAIAAWICGWSNLLSLGFKSCFCMLTAGFIAGLLLEWMAKAFDWWNYSELMPTLTLFGETVGLSPLLQITLLPLASVVLAARFENITRLLPFKPNQTNRTRK